MKKTLKLIYKNTVKKVFPSPTEILDTFLIQELGNASRILDLGCGPSSPINRIKSELKPDIYIVGVDDFAPYIEMNKKRDPPIHSEYIKSNIFNVHFPPKSFDGAILLDVIEHFDKKYFLNFLQKLETMTKKIIVMTPNGFIEQNEYDKNTYQIHRSGWTADELTKLGFTCYGVSGLKILRGQHGLPTIQPALLGNMIANMSEPFIRNKAERAYHLLCIKNTV